ncbi:serine hydrolase [Parvularcula sp. ZS-1/3]|uniref:Serine hydrolase n=1 Tax=Parvularcula mediterranea TaxID=2732508 RepID=A0A7Y3RJA7_9PROT|nr:serine hydrolase [Parvularcula mediterranea]NNU15118.1 serine hydrolase [Parvularcula mediterranea]
MGTLAKKAALAAGAVAAVLGVTWIAIGEDWRSLISNPPSDTNVLFWEQEQRDTGFRMLDKLPMLVKTSKIERSRDPRALPDGEPLDLGFDLDTYFKDNRIASVVILHNGKVRTEKYGLGFEADERWTSFSVAKSVTSTLVGAAIEDGYIESLDAPITDSITDLKGSAYEGVSVRQLLTMTSGVDWNEDYEDPNSDVAQFNLHTPEDPDMPVIVSYMKTLGRDAPAGERWLYSTGETNLIGILVTEATGKSLADYLSEKIWSVYGMEADATWLLGTDGQEISGCCIQATTRDFARFGQFILDGAMVDGERIVPDEWLGLATTKQADIGFPGAGYGYQWWTLDDGAFQARGIFGQGIFIDPERNLVIASNSSWSSALGARGGERDAREAFYKAVRDAVDREAGR